MKKRVRLNLSVTPELKAALEDYTAKMNALCDEKGTATWTAQDILSIEMMSRGYDVGEYISSWGGKRPGAGRKRETKHD